MTDDNVTELGPRRPRKRRHRPDEVTARAKAITEAATGRRVDERGPSQASQLVALARERYELFMSQDARPYGVVRGGANVALPLRGRAGLRSHLARIFTDATRGSVPSASALADALTVLEGIAAATEPRQPYIRVAPHGRGVVVDLADADGRCVVVDPDGWRVAERSPVLFRRSGAMKPLPRPVRDGDGLAALGALLNMSEDNYRLLVAWLVAAFLPELPHPILGLRGEQGSGKSKCAQLVIGLVDPSGAPKRTAPRDLRAWSTQAFNSWALCLDNVSTISDWLSDALCRAVTGDGVVDRALYSDDDVVVLEFRRVVALTTIDAGALAGDLAERLVTLELHTIPDQKRREEADLDSAYRDAHPAILASLLDLLADVLAVLPDVVLTSRPRMADFARVLAAVDKVTGWATLDTYRNVSRDAVSDVLEGDLFARAVVALVDQHGTWSGTASELFDALPAPDRPTPKTWPKDPPRAGGQLKRLAPALRTIGIEVDDSHRSNRSRVLHISARPDRRCETASPPSPLSPVAGNRPLTWANVEAVGDSALSPDSEAPLGSDGQGDSGDSEPAQGWAILSPSDQPPDLRKHPHGDSSDGGDAEMRLPSDAATSHGVSCECPTCLLDAEPAL